MLSCLTGVALLQSFVQPHLRPALVILISTRSASLGSLSEKGGSFGVWLCAGLCTLCVLTGIFFLFFDDARSGNYFALGVKLVGTLLCVLTGEWLYREKPAKAE